MSVRYYQDSTNFPYVILSVVERVKLYFAQLLYPEETQVNALKRIILANFSDDPAAIRRSIDKFKNSNGTFPCTFYSISDDEPVEYRSNLQKNGNFYSTAIGSYVRFIPMKLSIPMVTFFTTPFDFWRAMTFFAQDEADMTRLDVPVTINNILTSFVIDIEYITERGELAFDVEQQFQYGKLYPVVHSVTVKGAYITLDVSKDPASYIINVPQTIYHVDDIIFKLRQLEDELNLEANTILDTANSPSSPIVTSTTPIEGATNVSRSDPIVFNFNVVMNEETVINNIDIVPHIDKDYSFSADSKTLTITPRDLLTVSGAYTILINDSTTSADGINFEEDFELNFTVGVV
jgi:hypothetical protein